MQGKTNNYAKLTKLVNIIQWQREKNVTKRRQVQFVDEKRKRTSLQSELFYSSLNTSLSRYFSLISPKISFKYNSITLGKHIFNPKPVLKIPNTHRTMPLRQGLSFISNAAGHGGVAPLQDRAKLCQWSASAAPQQVEEQFPFSAVCAVHQCVLTHMDTGCSAPPHSPEQLPTVRAQGHISAQGWQCPLLLHPLLCSIYALLELKFKIQLMWIITPQFLICFWYVPARIQLFYIGFV